jgi:hypothetical protein
VTIPREVLMFAFRSKGCGRIALATAVLATMAACVVDCGSDSSIVQPLDDASLGGHDSGGQEPSGEAGGDSTVGDDVAAGDDGSKVAPGDDGSTTADAGDAAPGTTADAGSEAGDAETPGEAGPGLDAGDAGAGHDSGPDSSAPTDSGVAMDAGVVDAGGVGTIPCGTSNCTASTQVCCYGAGTPSCTDIGSCTGTPVDCRETANCQGGDICCFSARGAGQAAATCTPSASCTGLRLCGDGGDCVSSDRCAAGFCVPTGGFDGGFPGFDGGFPGFDGGFRGFDGGFPGH